jgi:hypothetical protein
MRLAPVRRASDVCLSMAFHVGNTGSNPVGDDHLFRFSSSPVPNRCQAFPVSESNPKIRSRLPWPYSQVKTVVDVRSLAIILVALLLPLSLSAPSTIACPTTACCGAKCASNAPVNQLSCCQRPVAPERATIQARDTQHFDSIGRVPIAGVIVAISHSRSPVVARAYSPPDRLVSLALLCSRQI